MTKQIENKIVEIYTTTKLGIKPIAKQFNTNQHVIRKILNNRNIKPKSYTNNEIILSVLQEDEIGHLYKNGLSMQNIEKETGINYGKIRKTLIKNKIYEPSKQNVVNLSENDEKEIIKLYESGKSLDRVGEIFKVGRHVIDKILIKNNIKIRSCTHFSRQHEVNENYFEIINTPDRAYFLGLLYADGYNLRNGRGFKLGLKYSDLHILETFKKSLNAEHEIKYSKSKHGFSLGIFSCKMSHDLTKLGCGTNKSLDLKFPTNEQVPEHLMNHFLRGIFCGDGSISNTRCKRGYTHYTADITNSVEFITELRKYINNRFGFHGYARTVKNKNEYARWSLSSYDEILIFLDWLYKDCGEFKLNRKYDRYIMMKTYKNRLFRSKYRKNNKNYKKRIYRSYGNSKCSSKKMEFNELII